MVELLQALASWRTFALVVFVFGFAPGLVLRLLVKVYARDDPRRRELVAELYAIRRLERPFFVAEQLETVLFEGVPPRLSGALMWMLRLSTRPLSVHLTETPNRAGRAYALVAVRRNWLIRRPPRLFAQAHLHRRLGRSWSIYAVARAVPTGASAAMRQDYVMYVFALRASQRMERS